MRVYGESGAFSEENRERFQRGVRGVSRACCADIRGVFEGGQMVYSTGDQRHIQRGIMMDSAVESGTRSAGVIKGVFCGRSGAH